MRRAIAAFLAFVTLLVGCRTPERAPAIDAGATASPTAHHLGAIRIPPYAQLLVSRNGGTPTSGPQDIAVTAGDVLTFSAGSSVGVTQWLWEIVDFPPGMALPTGWAWEGVAGASPMMFNGGFAPPAVTVPSQATANWGKIFPKLTVNGNPIQYLPSGAQNTRFNSNLSDSSTLVYLASPNGMEGLAFQETTQGDSYRSWQGTIMRILRTIDTAITGNSAIAGEAYILAADSTSLTLLAAGTPVLVPYAHAGATALNTAFSSNGVKANVPGPVKVDARVSFTAPAGPTILRFQLYQNATPLADAIQTKEMTAAQLDTVTVQSTQTAVAGDIFTLYAYSSGAGGSTTLAISSATLVVTSAGARQGPQGPTGPAGAGGGVGATGTPLNAAGSPYAMATGATSNGIDTTSGDVTVSLSNGATDGETKTFEIIAGAHDLIVNAAANNLYSAANNGVATGQIKVTGIAQAITLTWIAAANGAAGGWFTA